MTTGATDKSQGMQETPQWGIRTSWQSPTRMARLPEVVHRHLPNRQVSGPAALTSMMSAASWENQGTNSTSVNSVPVTSSPKVDTFPRPRPKRQTRRRRAQYSGRAHGEHDARFRQDGDNGFYDPTPTQLAAARRSRVSPWVPHATSISQPRRETKVLQDDPSGSISDGAMQQAWNHWQSSGQPVPQRKEAEMHKFQSIAAASIAAVGLVVGAVGAMWLTGTLGVSTATATAIAKAVEVGSWGMFLAVIATTGGLVGAGLWGTLRLIMWKAGKAAVVA